MKKIILFSAFLALSLLSNAQTFNIGDKVEIYNSGGWYKGSILAPGTGSMAGYYSVKYDGYTQVQWIKTSNIRVQKNAPATETAANGPRNGMYLILSYGNPSNPLHLGYFNLAGGQYSYYTMAKKLIGSGSYTYNSTAKTVQWISGPFKDSHWGGGFEIDREGKTHKIRLNTVTIGSNSTDSQ